MLVDAHIRNQAFPNDNYVWVKLALAGQPPAASAPEFDCCFEAFYGPFVQIAADGVPLWFRSSDLAYDDDRNAFTTNGVFPVMWLPKSDDAAAFFGEDSDPALEAALKTLSVQGLPFVGGGTSVMPAGDAALLAKALMAGAVATPFEVQSPATRLFGVGPAVSGHVLTLPDSSQKHVLDTGADGLPVLTDDARQDLQRFLAKK